MIYPGYGASCSSLTRCGNSSLSPCLFEVNSTIGEQFRVESLHVLLEIDIRLLLRPEECETPAILAFLLQRREVGIFDDCVVHLLEEFRVLVIGIRVQIPHAVKIEFLRIRIVLLEVPMQLEIPVGDEHRLHSPLRDGKQIGFIHHLHDVGASAEGSFLVSRLEFFGNDREYLLFRPGKVPDRRSWHVIRRIRIGIAATRIVRICDLYIRLLDFDVNLLQFPVLDALRMIQCRFPIPFIQEVDGDLIGKRDVLPVESVIDGSEESEIDHIPRLQPNSLDGSSLQQCLRLSDPIERLCFQTLHLAEIGEIHDDIVGGSVLRGTSSYVELERALDGLAFPVPVDEGGIKELL